MPSPCAVAETGAGADDPFCSLAGASIGLFIFVVGGAAYLTFQEQQSKKSIEEEDTKPRLPTLAELEAEGVRDEDALMNAADMPAATNRNERRQNKKLLKKRVEPQQDRARSRYTLNNYNFRVSPSPGIDPGTAQRPTQAAPRRRLPADLRAVQQTQRPARGGACSRGRAAGVARRRVSVGRPYRGRLGGHPCEFGIRG